MVLSVAMMLTMFPTGVLADDFDLVENTASITETAEGQSNDNQGEESDTAQVNAVEDEETQPETVQSEAEQTENDQTEPPQDENTQPKPDQTETEQTKQPEPGSTVPDQAGTQPDDKQPEPEQPATDPAENGVSDGAESTEGEQAESKTEFTVTWESEGETILTKTFAKGTSKDEVENAQPAENPVKEADGDVEYTFAGWTPDYADVTADQTYTATFEEASQQDELDEQDAQDEMVSVAGLFGPTETKVTGNTAIFCKINPNADENSNDSDVWTPTARERPYDTSSLGNASVVIPNWAKGEKNFKVNLDGEHNPTNCTITWPGNSNGYISKNTVDPVKNRTIWSIIAENYKDYLNKKYGVTIRDDDIESIRMIPYKISRDNRTKTDMHLDCLVEIVCSRACSVSYMLQDAGETVFTKIGGETYFYEPGQEVTTDPAVVLQGKYPPNDKVVKNVKYIFSGWYTDDQCTQPADFTQPLTQNTTFYAKYIPAPTYTVIYTDGVDGEDVFADQTYAGLYEGVATPAFTVNGVAKNPIREGYEFTGWSPAWSATVSGSVTYKAQWKQSEFEVKYQYDGETPANAPALPSSRMATYNTKVSVEAKPSVDGYTFTGWTSSDVEVDQDGKFTMPAKDVTLTGTWAKRNDLSYTVHYYWNGTTEKVHEDKVVPNKTYGEEVTEKVVVTINPGYTPVNSEQEEKINIGVGTNEITFYYYKNVELTANSKTETYDGTEKSVSGFTGAPKGADFSAITVGATGTDADTYPANFPEGTVGTFDATRKYIVTGAKPGKLTIAKREVTLTSASDSKVYDGTPLTNGNVTVGGKDGFAKGEGATYNVTGTQTKVGEGKNTFTYTLNKGTNADNYAITTTEGKLTVTKRGDSEKEDEKVIITANDNAATYDGEAHGAKDSDPYTCVNLAEGDRIESVEISGSEVNAGEYTGKLVPSNAKIINAAGEDVTGSYEIEYKPGTLTINKRAVTLTSASDSKVYDGTPLTNGNVTVGGKDGFAKGEGASYDVTGSQTVVGSSDNKFTYTLNDGTNADNYTITPTEGKLEVTPVTDKVTVTITGNTKTVTYDGKEHTVDGYSVSIDNALYTEADFTFSGTKVVKKTNANINDERYMMGLKAEQFQNTSKNFTNVTFVVAKDGWLKINPYMISIEPKETTFPYNGEEPKVKADKLEIRNENDGKDLLLDHHVESIETQGSGVDAGTYEWFSGHNAKILDGSGHDVTANYDINYRAHTMTITPAPLKITTDSATKTYDGSALTADGEIEGVVERDKKDVKLNITGRQTNAGTSNNTYTIEWGTAKATNYKIDEDIGTLTVNPLEGVVVTITGNTDTVPYNGKEQSVEGYTVEFTKNPGDLYKEADFKLNGEAKAAGTDAGTYNMGFVATSFENINPNFKNVVFNITDGWLKITPKEIVPGENNKDLTATAPKDVVYSGESQQQKPIVKDGDKVLEEGRDYTLTYSEDTTNVGTVTVTINGNGNYGSKFEVTYKITRAPLKITTNSAEKTYDGSALTADGKIEGVVERDKNDVKLNITGSQNTYKIEWGTAKASNYEITEDIGTLKVNARSGGGSSSKPTPEEEPTPTPTPTPLPTLPTTPAPTTPTRRVTRSTATVTEPASRPTEQITENETPKAESEPEVIEDEETPLAPMAGGAWALVNLILMLLTVLASLLLLLGYLGKKKYAKEDEYGNALHDANGNEIIDYTRNKKGFWRVASLIPAIAAVIAFALTENMRLPMVMTDRWTLLMVIIAVVQLIVAVLCKKKKESEEDENEANI